MTASQRIQRGFGRLAFVGAAITGLIVTVNLVLAAAAWFVLSFDGRNLNEVLKAENDQTIGYEDSAYLTAAREAKIIPPRWELAPINQKVTPPPMFELVEPTSPKPWEVFAFGQFVEDERRRRATREHLEIAGVVGALGAVLSAAVWVFGWVLAGFFT